MNPKDAATLACNFQRSSIRWRIDSLRTKTRTVSRPMPTTLNDVRMPLECLATVSRGGEDLVFGLGASCKTEQVFVERDIWMQPNADMCAVSGAGQFMVLTRWDKVGKGVMLHPPSLGEQPERNCVDPRTAFESHSLDVRRRPARRLDSMDEIIEMFRGDREVVSRTTYPIEDGDVTIEYPVKTVNYSDRHRYYQVDTGPVLYFGEATGADLISHFHPAFIAHRGGDWAEFLVCRPTLLDGTSVSVQHFSDPRRVSASNSLWLIDEP